MVRKYSMSLCRICLQEGATCCIFEDVDENNSVYSKLIACFNVKIEEKKGYPNNICISCNDTLNIVYDFINTFKESCKLLEDDLLVLKQEKNIDSSDNEADNCLTEIEIQINSIKNEPETLYGTLDNTEDIIELLQPLPDVQDYIKTESHKHKDKKKRLHKKYTSKADKVANSILEGEFAWTGEAWCLTSTQLKIPKDAKLKGKRRDTRLKLPRIRKDKQPKLCDLCGGVFKSAYYLKVHLRTIHFKNPIKCPQCPRMLSSQYNLDKHCKRKHSENKEFMCSFCGKGFAYKGELSNHMRKLHTSGGAPKKLFSCKYCDKTYKCLKSITIHERSAHTGERPAKCSICFKSFFHEEYLKEHMRLHTGEAPFKCPVCSRGYAQRCNMKSHLRIHRVSEIDAITLSKMKPNYLKLLRV